MMAYGFHRLRSHIGGLEQVVAYAGELDTLQAKGFSLIAEGGGPRGADAGVVLHLMVLAGEVGHQGYETSIVRRAVFVGRRGTEGGVHLLCCIGLLMQGVLAQADPEDRQHQRGQYSRFLLHHS